MTATQRGDEDADFTPPLPHDPPPPPGYVDPLEEAEVLADLTALITSGPEPAEDGRTPST